MPIDFTCPECAERNSVGPEFAGRRATCAYCGAAAIVPQTSGPAKSAAPLVTQGARSSSGTSWIVILSIACVVLLMCGGVLVALLLPAVSAAREAGRRASCMNKMKQINLALQNYEAAWGRLPPASGGSKDHPMSWRVAILPFMEESSNLYRTYHADEAWNSPANAPFSKTVLKEYVCPSDDTISDGETSYVMITGASTAGGLPGSRGWGIGEITDPARTIVVVEVHGLKIPWAEPRDITLEELIQRLRSGGRIGHTMTFNVAMADGSVKALPITTDAGTLRRLATVRGAKPVNIED